jgi:hypothetical protein
MKSRSVALLLGAFLMPLVNAVPALAFATCPRPPSGHFPGAPAAYTHTAVADGNWNVAATWGGSVPGNGAVVCIPTGRLVTVTSQETSRLRYIQVNGEMRLWIHGSTRLFVDTLFVASGGLFRIGTAANTVKPNAVAELVFISWNGNPIDPAWDPDEKSRGLISSGRVHIFGDPKTHMVPMTADAAAGATSLTVDAAPTNWRASDSVVLTGSYFHRTGAASSSLDELRTLTTASTSPTLNLSSPLSFEHTRPRSDLRLHVANLTRNVIFRSELTAPTWRRGHVMLLSGDVDIRHLALVDLGRTDKKIPLNDAVVTPTGASYHLTIPAPAAITNRRGRYSLHFHLNGIQPGAAAPPSKVYSSVVVRTPGWGFVNHSSHVDFQNNVAYDFDGAGFVTEAGDELGNFFGNIAIRGNGNGQYRPIRLVFQNPERPQPLGDFAFSGDGFWFQGPAVRARNNVASGCDGAGMMWFTTGTPDITQRFDAGGGLVHDRYTSFPRSAVNQVYAGFPDLGPFLPRYWDHSVTNEKLVIADLPILECDGFEAYGNLVGFRLRFNNQGSTAWYTEDPFNFDVHLVPVIGTSPSLATRMRERVRNLTLWNNEQAFRMRYTQKWDFTNVTALNRLDYSGVTSFAGAELFHQNANGTFTNLLIDGYEVAGWIENAMSNNRGQISFLGTRTYLNYATFDTWKENLACPLPSGATVTVLSPTSRRISWNANNQHQRYLVRYRAVGEQQWKLADTTGTQVTLSGLSTGRTYTYQIVAGCKDPASGQETRPSNYTAAATFGT